MKREILTIDVIGQIADDYLHNEGNVKFLNLTSHGAFLECGENNLLFLSFEEFHGPLTANLTGMNICLHDISKGDIGIFEKGKLTFIDSQAQIEISNAKLWSPTPINKIDLINPDIRKSRNQNLAEIIIENRNPDGFSALIQRLIKPAENNIINNYLDFSNLPDINKIRDFLIKYEYGTLGQYLENFLGMGPGLTPSGDDFILGVILSINRWKTILNLHPSYEILNQELTERARQKTNMISAELIRCAALGQADERLIQAVDYLAGANINMEVVLDGLINWGNSSGIDAFAGMTTVFSLIA